MRIELLYFDGCPDHAELRARVPRLLEQAGVDATIEEHRIDSEDSARRERFLGSPTLRVDGRDMVIGGTSAVAPLYAGLVALLNQKLGRPVGFLNPSLYGAAAEAIQDITEGNNGAYVAGIGWDACTGLGRIDGTRLLAALGKHG